MFGTPTPQGYILNMTPAQAIVRLAELGLPLDKLADALSVLEAMERGLMAPVLERRAKDRERKRTEHVSTEIHGNPRKHVEVDGNPITKEIPPTPPKENNIYKPTNTRVTRGSRLPNDFEPSPEALAVASELGFTGSQIKFEVQQFTDYWRGVPGSKGLKLDWQATLKNRFRDEHKRNKFRHVPKQSASEQFKSAANEIRQELAGSSKILGQSEYDWVDGPRDRKAG
jgi:hypothetical protein